MTLLLDHHEVRRGSPDVRGRRAPGETEALRSPHAAAAQALTSPLPAAPARGRTLDDVLTGTWAGLTSAATTACPVCSGELVARWSAGAGVVGGRCRDCGSELA